MMRNPSVPRGDPVIVSAAFFVAALAATDAQAFACAIPLEGAPSLIWAERTIVMTSAAGPVRAGIEAETLAATLSRAVDAWVAPACTDLDLSAEGPVDVTGGFGFDWSAPSGAPGNRNVVVIRTGGSAEDPWIHPDNAIAITTLTYVRTSGHLVDADIELNAARFEFTACEPGPGCVVRQDLQNTLTHEVGHVVGLDHPDPSEPGARAATMFASAPLGDLSKRDLAPDDEAGVCFLYPAGGPLGECAGVARTAPVPIEVVDGSCGGCAGAAFLPFVLLPFRRRVRRVAR